MQVSHSKFNGGLDSGVPSLNEVDLRVADARRAQSRAVAGLLSSCLNVVERHLLNRPRKIA